MALEFLYRGLTYRTPSGELCCDIGKHFFDRKKWEQAVFWYRNALQVSENAKTGGFVEKQCYGYIPCIQLSVCWYYLDDIEKAFNNLNGGNNVGSGGGQSAPPVEDNQDKQNAEEDLVEDTGDTTVINTDDNTQREVLYSVDEVIETPTESGE